MKLAADALDSMFAMMDRYGITRPAADDPYHGPWFDLALALATQHEPGFNPFPGRPGAHASAGVNDVLIVHALGAAKTTKKSVAAAALHLSKHPRFRGMSPGYIRKRFYVLMKPGTSEGERLRNLVRALSNTSNQN